MVFIFALPVIVQIDRTERMAKVASFLKNKCKKHVKYFTLNEVSSAIFYLVFPDIPERFLAAEA